MIDKPCCMKVSMEEYQRDKALYEAVRKYKGKVHFHKDPVRKKEERTDE